MAALRNRHGEAVRPRRAATHPFEEAGAREAVARLASAWFAGHFEEAAGTGSAGPCPD